MYKGQCSYRYLKGRQGTSTKRANGNFPCRAWKIVISLFNYPGRIQQNSAGHVCPPSSTAAFHRFPPVPQSAAICGNLGQFACADYLTDLTVVCDCVPPSFNVRLPCDACISGGSSGCFSGFFLLDWSFGPGTARVPLKLFNKIKYLGFFYN